MVKATCTDAAGNFSFGSLPTSTYVYPEKMNYAATPANAITLTTSQATRQGINFNQDDADETIAPRTTGVAALATVMDVGISPQSCRSHYHPALGAAPGGGPARNHYTGHRTDGVRDDRARRPGRTAFDIRGLQPGVYFVRMQRGAESGIQKLIME